MPALHDFSMFLAYAKMVIQSCQQCTSAKEREWCASILDHAEIQAEATLGKKQLPVRNLGDAFAERLADAQHQKLFYTSLAASLSDIAAVLSSKVDNFQERFSPEYGTLFSSNEEALQNSFICACIDATVTHPVWCNAFRILATTPVTPENTTFWNRSAANQEGIALLNPMIVGRAVQQSDVLRTLSSAPCQKTILLAYGNYVMSNASTAYSILFDYTSMQVRTKAMQDIRIRNGLKSIMWNLTALDHNSAASPIPMLNRVEFNLRNALEPNERIQDLWSSGLIKELVRDFYKELNCAKTDMKRFRRIRRQIYVTNLRLRQFMAWSYIVFVISVSISSAVFDWSGSSNILERCKGAFELATIMLVTVFGLIKLTSEDVNTLKNMALGRKLLHTLDDGALFFNGQVDSVRKLVSVDVETLDLVDSRSCSYARVKGAEDGLDIGPASVSTLKQCGFFFLEGICKKPQMWDTHVTLTAVDNERAKIHDESIENRLFVQVPSFSKLS